MSALAYIIVCLWLCCAREGQVPIAICPSKLLYGIPCPGCGVTRATISFLEWHFSKALALNPNCILAIAFIFFYPIIVICSLIYRQSYILYFYNIIVEKLADKRYLFPLLLFEVCVWLHNIIVGI